MPRVNLVPGEEKQRELRRRMYIVPVAGTIILAGILGGTYYYYSNRLDNADRQLQDIKQSNNALQKQVAEMKRYDEIKNKNSPSSISSPPFMGSGCTGRGPSMTWLLSSRRMSGWLPSRQRYRGSILGRRRRRLANPAAGRATSKSRGIPGKCRQWPRCWSGLASYHRSRT